MIAPAYDQIVSKLISSFCLLAFTLKNMKLMQAPLSITHYSYLFVGVGFLYYKYFHH